MMVVRRDRRIRYVGPILACLFFIYLIANFLRAAWAFNISDWVLETLEDHTNKPRNEKDFVWLNDRNDDLNAWSLGDQNIDYARCDIELSLVSLYFGRLSDRQVSRMRADSLNNQSSQDKDQRDIGNELMKLIDLRTGKIALAGKDLVEFRSLVANQIRTSPQNLEAF